MMTLKRSLIVCSSPNGRGIYRYARGLARVGSVPILCPKTKSGFMLWEQLGLIGHLSDILRARYVFFANTRVSPLLWPFIDWKRTVVVMHDLMMTVDFRYLLEEEIH